MKSISDAAMDAIEAGEAIVTGALEIYSRGSEPIELPAGTDIVLAWVQNSEPPPGPGLYAAGRMEMQFLDLDGDEITDLRAGADWYSPPTGTWVARSVSGASSPEAVTLRIFMLSQEGPANSGQAFDAVALSIGGETFPLANPGAEAGTTAGWDFTPGGLGDPFFSVTSASGITPYAGSRFFLSGDRGLSGMWQDIALSVFEPTDPEPPVAIARIWGGYGPIELDGEVYQGIGDRGLVQQTAGAIGGVAQGLTLTLSGIEPELLSLLDDVDEIKGGAAVMRRLIFASDGKMLLDYDVWDRGRIDTIETEQTVGGGAAIKVAVESAARGLGRSGARQRADSDQRLIDANDGYFKFVAYAGEKMLYWGGKKPSRTGDATGGGFGSFTSGVVG